MARYTTTYTLLRKDPKLNLYTQLAINKVVKLFRPEVGRPIFHRVRAKLGSQTSPIFRSEGMMQDPERIVFQDAVWNCPQDTDEYEIVVVRPEDALFILKGWLHSIKSINMDVSASVTSGTTEADVPGTIRTVP